MPATWGGDRLGEKGRLAPASGWGQAQAWCPKPDKDLERLCLDPRPELQPPGLRSVQKEAPRGGGVSQALDSHQDALGSLSTPPTPPPPGNLSPPASQTPATSLV